MMLSTCNIPVPYRYPSASALIFALLVLGCSSESSSTNTHVTKGLSGIELKYEPVTTQGETHLSFDSEVGSITGRLLYRADAERPWLYGKYYLKNSSEGELAVAVVCLSSKKLRKEKHINDQPKTWDMNQKHHQFTPEVLAVQIGDRVEFTNSDQVTHNVNAQGSLETFNLMTPIANSEVHQFNKAGNEFASVQIRCNLHSQMYAQVYVFSHPYFQVTTGNGQFVFHDVPAGEYDLVVIHPSGELKSRDHITVKANRNLIIKKTVSADDLLKSSSGK